MPYIEDEPPSSIDGDSSSDAESSNFRDSQAPGNNGGGTQAPIANGGPVRIVYADPPQLQRLRQVRIEMVELVVRLMYLDRLNIYNVQGDTPQYPMRVIRDVVDRLTAASAPHSTAYTLIQKCNAYENDPLIQRYDAANNVKFITVIKFDSNVVMNAMRAQAINITTEAVWRPIFTAVMNQRTNMWVQAVLARDGVVAVYLTKVLPEFDKSIDASTVYLIMLSRSSATPNDRGHEGAISVESLHYICGLRLELETDRQIFDIMQQEALAGLRRLHAAMEDCYATPIASTTFDIRQLDESIIVRYEISRLFALACQETRNVYVRSQAGGDDDGYSRENWIIRALLWYESRNYGEAAENHV